MGIKPLTAGWPELAGWLSDELPAIQKNIIYRSWQDIGIVEQPLGSNKSGRINQFCTRSGSPIGSYWCACAVSCWFADAGADTPAFGKCGSCDEWMAWAKKEGLWRLSPVLGGAILYGVPGDARHIGIVVRIDPLVLTVEGNRAYKGVSNNGVAVDINPPNRTDILGYVQPRAA